MGSGYTLDTLDDAAFARLSRQLTPAAFYLRTDDQIRVTSYNAASAVILTARSRILGCDGAVAPSVDTHTPNTDRTARSTILRGMEGWLLGGQVFVSSGAPLIGQCFVVVELVQGEGAAAVALQTLAAGYVTAKQPLSWPGQPIAQSLDGGGAIRAIVGSVPGAGNNFSETVPTGARWELLSLEAALINSATVANRTVALTIDDGAAIYFIDSPAFVTTASQTSAYSFAQGESKLVAPVLTGVMGNLPGNNRLLAGHRIRSSVINLQAGDAFSAPNMLVREWIEGA
jgi:hypothetical protein